MGSDPAGLGARSVFEEETFEGLELAGMNLAGKEFSHCTFHGVSFTGTLWRGVDFDECVFEHCDLSNVQLGGASLRGVEFRGSKLVGTSWSDFGTPLVVGFTECNLRYVACAGIDLRRTKLTRCSLVDARFLDVNLSKCIFESCDLSQTSFEQCTLTGADFVTSTNVFFDAMKNRAKGARISLDTAGLMAAALGLLVKGR